MFKKRGIKPEIVGLWVEEGICDNPPEHNAVKIGYPEFRDISDKL